MSRSNVINFLPPLTFNKKFIEQFVAENLPCAALGIVETRGQQTGFLAIKTEKPLSDATTQNGFDLGTELLGKKDLIVLLHLILNFDSENIFDVLLNLNAPVTKRVLQLWEKTGNYFFFAFSDTGFTAFNQNISDVWFQESYFEIMEKAKNTNSQYEDSVEIIKRKNDMMHGKYLGMVFQENLDFLDLNGNRFEVKGSY